MDGLLLRSFRESDRQSLIGLWESCDLVRPWNDAGLDIDRKVADDAAMLIVALRSTGTQATDDEDLVGSVMAGYDGHRGWVNYLAVDPSVRVAGIGRRLMSEAERRLAELGCVKVNLQIRRTDAGAVDFYDALGYVEDDVISMGKRLAHDESER